ncbi:hypothetical protein XEU83M_14100 [Xanthomonas euvesicatoria]|nr:hypothetical protein XEU66b_05545 [Xanthomonas euvesicatoria]KHL65018.1 hypothetical protein XEU83M_14100 [Xanthomonas euvesicatoria]KLA60097.1 hypothetical protein XEUV684_09700 [Xanthomonas euvesicatoria]KLA63653.1 hypothetical protein XEUV695_19715 [Xanthomonas euvesicatoria]KLA74112.1 hypothetical protein XEUVF42_07215 [Xanthomonas euvesicatoria]
MIWILAADKQIFGLAAGALARPPSRDTLQVRPCKLLGGIHAAKGHATVGGQGPVKLVDVSSFQQSS